MELLHVPSEQLIHSLLEEVGFGRGAWRRGVAEVKDTYNKAFKLALARLHKLLRSRDPAAWIHEAMQQLVQWTFVYRGRTDIGASPELAPAARYGWRYVTDFTLRAAANPPALALGCPTPYEVWDAFSLLVILSFCVEQSNLLHFFPEDHSSAYLHNDDPLTALDLRLDEPQTQMLQSRMRYLQQAPNVGISGHLHHKITHEPYTTMLNAVLPSHAGFRVEDLKRVLAALIEISAPNLVVVHSRDYMVEWISDLAELSRSAANAALEFMLLTPERLSGLPRDFVRRADGARMLYFAGVRLPRPDDLEALYERESITSAIYNDRHHLVLSAPMAAECIDNTEMIIYGARPDLRAIPWLQPVLDAIQLHYHRDVFEHEVANVYRRAKWTAVCSIETMDEQTLPCGEIDTLALNSTHDQLDIVEAKAISPVSSVVSPGWVDNSTRVVPMSACGQQASLWRRRRSRWNSSGTGFGLRRHNNASFFEARSC